MDAYIASWVEPSYSMIVMCIWKLYMYVNMIVMCSSKLVEIHR
jgi:hypothetical protein